MKRLVIYIFILFSFTFIFIEKSNAKGVLQYCKASKYYQWTVVFVQEHEFKSYCTKVYKNKNPVLYEGIKKRLQRGQSNHGTKHLKIISTKSLVRLIEQSKAFDNTLNDKKLDEEKKKIENEKKKIAEEKKRLTKKKKDEEEKKRIAGERSIALSWQGYADLIAGTVKFNEKDNRGTLNLSLPNNDGTCDGTYSLQEGGKGTWQIACSNNMGSAGTLKWIKGGSVTGIGRDHKDKKVKFTVSNKS